MTYNQITYAQHKENQRHNIVTEEVNRGTLQETQRHNLETERQGVLGINETVRHNKASEGIGYMQANAAMTSAQAALSSAAAQHRQADTAQYKAETDRNKYSTSMGGLGFTYSYSGNKLADSEAAQGAYNNFMSSGNPNTYNFKSSNPNSDYANWRSVYR